VTVIDAVQVTRGGGGGAGLVVVCVAVWCTVARWVVVVVGAAVVGAGFDVVTTDAVAWALVGVTSDPQAASNMTQPPAQSAPAQRSNDLDTEEPFPNNCGNRQRLCREIHLRVTPNKFLDKFWTRVALKFPFTVLSTW
jgi:hypothetical protein